MQALCEANIPQGLLASRTWQAGPAAQSCWVSSPDVGWNTSKPCGRFSLHMGYAKLTKSAAAKSAADVQLASLHPTAAGTGSCSNHLTDKLKHMLHVVAQEEGYWRSISWRSQLPAGRHWRPGRVERQGGEMWWSCPEGIPAVCVPSSFRDQYCSHVCDWFENADSCINVGRGAHQAMQT